LSIANVCLQHKSTFGVHYRTASPGQLGLRVAGSQNVTQFHVWWAQKNRVLGGGPGSPMGRGTFGEKYLGMPRLVGSRHTQRYFRKRVARITRAAVGTEFLSPYPYPWGFPYPRQTCELLVSSHFLPLSSFSFSSSLPHSISRSVSHPFRSFSRPPSP